MATTSNALSTASVGLAGLDEVEELTREYSLYSRSAAGLGNLPGVLLFVVGASLGAGGVYAWGAVLVAVAPWVWIVSSKAIARRLYQRGGWVTEHPSDEARIWHYFGLILLSFIAMLVIVDGLTRNRAVYRDALQQPAGFAVFVVPISLLLFTATLWIRARSGSLSDTAGCLGAAVLFWAEPFRSTPHWGVWMLVMGIGLAGQSIHEHLKYRRIERRLARLTLLP